MASAGYGDETTWESIFNVTATAVDATRFGHLNVYIAQQFNFYITGDANTDIADTKVTPMLASTTHMLIWEVYLEAKSANFANPWDQMTVSLGRIDFYRRFRTLIKYSQDILYGRLEVVTRNLPDSNDRTY